MLSEFRTEVQPLNDAEVSAYLRRQQLPMSNEDARQVHQINFSQAREFAKDKKTTVFWWPADVKHGGLKALPHFRVPRAQV